MITIEDLRHFFPYLRTDIMLHHSGNYGIWEERGWHPDILGSAEEEISKKFSFKGNTIYVINFKDPRAGWVRAHSPWNDFLVFICPRGYYWQEGYKRYCKKDELIKWFNALHILSHCKKANYPDEGDIYFAPDSFYHGRDLNATVKKIIGGINYYSLKWDENRRCDDFFSFEECRDVVCYYDNLLKEIEEYEDICH